MRVLANPAPDVTRPRTQLDFGGGSPVGSAGWIVRGSCGSSAEAGKALKHVTDAPEPPIGPPPSGHGSVMDELKARARGSGLVAGSGAGGLGGFGG